MPGLRKREPTAGEPFARSRWLNRAFDGLLRLLSLRHPIRPTRDWMQAEMMKVDELREDGALIIRAELPGIDPEQDVSLTVIDGMLNIEAEGREEEARATHGDIRRELRYGSFTRTLRLPDRAAEDDITATYRDGILEVRIPSAEADTPRRRIKITTA